MWVSGLGLLEGGNAGSAVLIRIFFLGLESGNTGL